MRSAHQNLSSFCILSPFLFASKRLGRLPWLQPQSGFGPFALAKTTDGILARNSQLNLFLLVETSPLISLLQDFCGLYKLPQVQACNPFNYFTSQHIPKDLIIISQKIWWLPVFMKLILSPELRAQTTSDKNIYLHFNNAEPLSIHSMVNTSVKISKWLYMHVI